MKGVKEKKLFSIVQDKSTYAQWEIQIKELLDIGIKFNLFIMNDKYVRLTNNGKQVLDMATYEFDLNDKQKSFIVENCIFNNSNFSNLLNFLSMFVFNVQHKTMIYNNTDYPIQDIDIEILTHLDIIFKDGTYWKLNSNYIEFIYNMRYTSKLTTDKPKTEMTQEQLEQILIEQKEIGELGENLSIKYEKDRLKNNKLVLESNKIKHVSKHNVNLGYDIQSFNGKISDLTYDFFIEVKARKQNIFSFIISSNEIQAAKKLGNRYAIYFWNNLGYMTPSKPTQIIYDPINKLNIKECENCLSYIIYLDKYN